MSALAGEIDVHAERIVVLTVVGTLAGEGDVHEEAPVVLAVSALAGETVGELNGAMFTISPKMFPPLR